MQTTIDHFGRVTIPKTIREHLGLKPGTLLRITEHNNEVLLAASEPKPSLKLIDGILVFCVRLTENIENSIEEHRQQRITDQS